MVIKKLRNYTVVFAGLTAFAVLPAGAAAASGGGAEPPGTQLCGPRATGFAALYCPWDGARDGDPTPSQNRSADRESVGR
ncbi:hypothetical protein KIH27_21135 [Mycobacterium sp. M1]|uniref:Secreted protein n=1 Tax=Mycolicibacter acidiphilus TaxID=2835306 RepID=A0ABS5RRH7_9MYCO|nr:hypothetical protein [Mycolicibacter acidiphilus]MBS9536091.1 hypothetical protein [Mycolicibacter acidiphilus]